MRRLLLTLGVLLLLVSSVAAQSGLSARLSKTIKAAGVPIIGISIGDYGNKATWLVQPPELQGAAQKYIDAFDANAPEPPKGRRAIASGAVQFDLAESRAFVVPLTRDVSTVEFANVPLFAGDPIEVRIVFTTQGVIRTVTWPRGVRWLNGTAPTFDGGDGAYVVDLRRFDDSAVWFGTVTGPFN